MPTSYVTMKSAFVVARSSSTRAASEAGTSSRLAGAPALRWRMLSMSAAGQMTQDSSCQSVGLHLHKCGLHADRLDARISPHGLWPLIAVHRVVDTRPSRGAPGRGRSTPASTGRRRPAGRLTAPSVACGRPHGTASLPRADVVPRGLPSAAALAEPSPLVQRRRLRGRARTRTTWLAERGRASGSEG